MANEIWKKSKPTITAQASAAIGAGTISAGALTDIDRTTASANAQGAFEADVYVDVTVAPSGGDATAEILMSASEDDSNYCANEYCLSVTIPDGWTGRFHAGIVELPKYCRLKIRAIDYGFTASLLAVPELPEVQ